MAFTYKIKPLQWQPHFGFAFNAYLDGVHVGQAENVEGKWIGVFFDSMEEEEFDRVYKAKEFVEERHIAKVREYLEALE